MNGVGTVGWLTARNADQPIAFVSMAIRTRIAPTPSGFLHWGNAFSFILTWLIARKSAGTLVLRIDDLDEERKRPDYLEDIFRSLDWLGLDYDVGPTGPDEHERQYSQRRRMDRYQVLLDALRHCGIVFGCSCSRRSIQKSPDRLHPSSCRQNGTPLDRPDVSWRIDTSEEAHVMWQDVNGRIRDVGLHRAMRDFVVRRKDHLPAYQLASLADDLDLGINLIVRGEDLLASTAAQRFLAGVLEKPEFTAARFLHHPLMLDSHGRKLSKSEGSTSLRAMRECHTSPDWLYGKLSPYFGLEVAAHSAVELLTHVNLDFDLPV